MKKLRYKNIIWGLIVVILLAIVFYSAYLCGFNPTMLISWYSSLVATVISAFFAILIAIFVYWRQIENDKEDKKTILQKYLNYLIQNLPDSDDKDTIVNIKFVNTSIINMIINTGYFHEISFELVKLQAKIEYYVLFSEETIRIQNKDNTLLQTFQKQNVDNARNNIVEEAKTCLECFNKYYSKI